MADSTIMQKTKAGPARKKTAERCRSAAVPLIDFGIEDYQNRLLRWYDSAKRDLPWRAKNGEAPDPYKVWLSEIMLQQTTVTAVKPYFSAFLEKWPNVKALADAQRNDIMAMWAGLGYYSRARNLHDCAKHLALNGFPQEQADLLKLPGIGPYTSAAIAAIAFDRSSAIVDGNVERVIARLFTLEDPPKTTKALVLSLATALTPEKRPGDYAQAIMDLGATICTPRSPSCLLCPVQCFCKAFKTADPANYPRKQQKTERPIRKGTAFVYVNFERDQPYVLLRRRSDKGLLGGMLEVPSTAWLDQAKPQPSIEQALIEWNGLNKPLAQDWHKAGLVGHTFTHFHLDLSVWSSSVSRNLKIEDPMWVPLKTIKDYALPSLMRKVIATGLSVLALETQL